MGVFFPERERDVSFHFSVHSLVDSGRCPDRGPPRTPGVPAELLARAQVFVFIKLSTHLKMGSE